MPMVSVLIATYNRAHYIQEAIDSVLAQTFIDYEIIVVDDGSTDKTKELIQRYGDKIRYFYQSNQGKSTAQNFAVSQAKGEYVALLDDDDVWFSDKLEIQMNILEHNPDIGFVCSESYFINQKGERTRHWKRKISNLETFVSLYEENFIQHSTVVVRKKYLDRVGGLDTQLKTTEDYDLWLRLAKVCKFKYIDRPLVNYRQHTTNKHTNTTQKLIDRVAVVSKPENQAHLNPIQKRIRIAREYHIHAQYFQDLSQWAQAAENYFKALLLYPFIGLYYTQQDARSWQSLGFYRIVRTYLKMVHCFMKSLKRIR